MEINAQPPFRATGKGYFTSQPTKPASAGTGNARLINRDVHESDPLHDLWLYVTHVETGWSLGGETGQAREGNSFFPKNLMQDEVSIEGICVNQHEYDRIVEFVAYSQRTALDPQVPDGGRAMHRVDFKLLPSVDPTGKWLIHPPMYYGGHFPTIVAGHERFQFQPRFQLTLKVTFDYLAPQQHRGVNIDKLMERYLLRLGVADHQKFDPPKLEYQSNIEEMTDQYVDDFLAETAQQSLDFWESESLSDLDPTTFPEDPLA
jgi:hypothetical protein